MSRAIIFLSFLLVSCFGTTSNYKQVKIPTLFITGTNYTETITAFGINRTDPRIQIVVANPTWTRQQARVICHEKDNELLGYYYEDIIVDERSDYHLQVPASSLSSGQTTYICKLMKVNLSEFEEE
jgi:hypothetical protein